MMTSLTALTNPLTTAAFSTPSTAAWATSLAPETAESATMLACSVVLWATGGQEAGSRKQEGGSSGQQEARSRKYEVETGSRK